MASRRQIGVGHVQLAGSDAGLRGDAANAVRRTRAGQQRRVEQVRHVLTRRALRTASMPTTDWRTSSFVYRRIVLMLRRLVGISFTSSNSTSWVSAISAPSATNARCR